MSKDRQYGFWAVIDSKGVGDLTYICWSTQTINTAVFVKTPAMAFYSTDLFILLFAHINEVLLVE